MKRSGYTISTFVFNFFELGVFINVLLRWGLVEAMLVGFCCKIGKFLHESIHIGNTKQWTACTIVFMIISILLPRSFVVICIVSMAIEIALMKLRMLYKKRLTSWKTQKVFARMLAFFLAPFFEFWLLALFAVFLVADLIRCDGNEREEFPGIFLPQDKKFTKQYWMMFLHHTHYFSYCYIIPFLLIRQFNIALPLVGIFFFAGWSAYNIYEPFVPSKASYFLIGHIIAALGVVTIWFLGNNLFLCLLGWFFTGLGGGTVYMINGLMHGSNSIHSSSSKAVESYGHVLGLGISFIGVVFQNTAILYASSIFFATITITLSALLPKKDRTYASN